MTDHKDRSTGANRRQFLTRSGGAVAAVLAAGAAGYELRQPGSRPGTGGQAHGGGAAGQGSPAAQAANVEPAPDTAGAGLHRFVTRPDLRPPHIEVNALDGALETEDSPRFVALTPLATKQYPGVQKGPMLVDRRGRLVWFAPIDQSVFGVDVQSYRGKPVLTWWQGVLDGGGYGVTGTVVVADERYRTVASIPSRHGLPLDIHELNLTPSGTALLTSYQPTSVNLTGVKGPAKGQVLAGHALEIDVASGKVLLDWNSLDYAPVTDSYLPYKPGKNAWDYFHINSVAVAHDGNLLISGRHTSCIYKVNRKTGAVIWRMGGKRSNFQIARDAQFSYQHHVRSQGASELTLFNNASGTPGTGASSTGLWLNVDERKHTVTLRHRYETPARFNAFAMGSIQPLRNGNVFVGWGMQPYFSEFKRGGELVMNAHFAGSDRSYRTFLVDWVGKPTQPPAIAVRKNTVGGSLVYASWNGATEIDRWTVLAGHSAHSLKAVGSLPWAGFETVIAINSEGPHFMVLASDRHGHELGRSKLV